MAPASLTHPGTAVVLALLLAVAVILLIRRLAWLALCGMLAALPRLPARVRGSRGWLWTTPARAWFARRHPRADAFLRARLSPREFSGLPLTLIAAAALYLIALLGGLIEEVVEATEIAGFDNAVNAFFTPYRTDAAVAAFLWITNLGAGPALVGAALVATGFLWADRRPSFILPLWITFLGAQATTWLGKYVLGRHRPDFVTVATAVSPSFPSGHTTGATAVYGFLAYAVVRHLARRRERFEVVFWTAVLILAIGFSRIFLGVHYASDVAAGFLVGGFWLLVSFTGAERARR